MPLLVFTLVFVIGLVVGSFLNVAILRGARGDGLGGRSRCMACGKELSARELIPVVSFLWQKGRCRSCGAALSWQYPIVELMTGFLLVGAAWHLSVLFFSGIPLWLGGDGQSALAFAFGYWLLVSAAIASGIVIIVSDIRWQIIPDGAVLILLLVGGIVSVFGRGIQEQHPAPGADMPIFVWERVLFDVIAACIISMFFACFWFFSRGRWMGLGDAKLALATSLAVGFPASLAAFVFSFWLGGAAGVFLLAFGNKDLKSRIPFGPFIIAGAGAAYFFSARFLVLTGLSMLF